ncbi:hypothetical protein GCM10022406_08890 [Hymenobacter algoricola]|uniref:DUF4296 domain-containing protein n=2 Tax=Hymenobacter algoricola TaxID=486267 RepID=A0ABP7MMK0_9BACT
MPLLLLLTLLLGQCQRPEEALPPQPLLPKDKMVSLLVQIHLTEARVEATNLPADSSRALYRQLHKDLLWRQDVTDSLFQRSYRYYAVHEKDLDEIYGVVIDSLTRRKELLNAPKPAPGTAPPADLPKWDK